MWRSTIGRGPEPLGEQDPEGRGIHLRQVEVRVAEARVELDRDALAGGRLDRDDDQVVEQGLRLDPDPAVAPGGLVDVGERGGRVRAVDELDAAARSGTRSPT